MNVGLNSCMGRPKSDDDYLFVWNHVLLPIATAFDPQLVIISAGFDAAEGDPLGGYAVTPRGYAQLTRSLLDADLGAGNLVVALEGGYSLDAISRSMAAVASAVLGSSPDDAAAAVAKAAPKVKAKVKRSAKAKAEAGKKAVAKAAAAEDSSGAGHGVVDGATEPATGSDAAAAAAAAEDSSGVGDGATEPATGSDAAEAAVAEGAGTPRLVEGADQETLKSVLATLQAHVEAGAWVGAVKEHLELVKAGLDA